MKSWIIWRIYKSLSFIFYLIVLFIWNGWIQQLRNYKNYLINWDDTLLNLKTRTTLKGKLLWIWYLQVTLYSDRNRKSFYIYCLVVGTFIETPNNLPEVDHVSENKLDNRVKIYIIIDSSFYILLILQRLLYFNGLKYRE